MTLPVLGEALTKKNLYMLAKTNCWLEPGYEVFQS